MKYVVIVHRGVRYEMNFTHLSDDGVILDVDRDVFSENIERKWRPEQISKKMGGSGPTGRVGISGIEKWVLTKNER